MRGSAVQVRLVALLASQPHLRPNSRIVGYAAVAVVTMALMFFGWRIYVYTQLELDYAWVHFSGNGDLIGSLQEDDPVAIQGVDVGQIEDILSDTTGVLVRLRFWKHQRLYRDARALNVGNGLMGMRYILLERGLDSSHPLDRNAAIEGIFNPGIAEVMSGIQEVVAMANEIQAWLDEQATGRPGQPPLHKKLMDKVTVTTTLLEKLDGLSGRLQKLGPAIQTGGKIAKGLTDTLRAMEPGLQHALRTTDSVLVQTRRVLIETRALVNRTDTVLMHVAAPLEPLTRDDSLLRRVERTLKLVDVLEDFVVGRTEMKTNIHLLGKNPSKRGE